MMVLVAITTISSIKYLHFYDLPLGDDGAKAVLEAVKVMPNLQDLYLGRLPLGDDEAKAVLEAVKVMPNLQELIVENKEGTSISEVGKLALREAKELVKARSKVDHYYS